MDKETKTRLKFYNDFISILKKEIHKRDKRSATFIEKNESKLNDIQMTLGSCYIYGEAGTGKTIYAIRRMYEWVRLNYMQGHAKKRIEFRPVPMLIDDLKEEMNRRDFEKRPLLSLLIECDLLVLDDLSAIQKTDWTYQVIYTIIDARYKSMKPTIYTNNASLNDFAEEYNDDRIPSRIEHDCGDSILLFKNNKRKNKMVF